jgi:uncharacterized protein
MKTTVLILPGFGSSGMEHWQSFWERKHPDFKRVEQRDWEHPVCEEWVEALEKAVEKAGSEVILVAHSLACLVVAHWASKPHRRIKAALLVAPPDTAHSSFPEAAKGFESTPLIPFDFPSILVASTNDEYASIEYAHTIATAWGSAFVNVSACGHINANSALGFWDEGFALLEKLRQEC